jgi:SagB-type dehydrogenase family enzyme
MIKTIAMIAGCSAALGAGLTADSVLSKALALDSDLLAGLRMAVFEADKVADIDVLLKAADEKPRAAFLERVPERTRAAYEDRLAKFGALDAERVAEAVDSINAFLVPPEIDAIRGQTLVQLEKYREGAEAYEAAFKAGGGNRLRYYVAADAWALAGDSDNAFRNLGLAVANGWTDAKMAESDTDLSGLKADPRWAGFVAKMQAERDKRLSTLPDSHKVLSTVKLPQPVLDGTVSVEATMARRRSVRQYGPGPLTLAEVSQLLWAAYGVTKPVPEVAALRGGLKTAPSAGACYPLEIYLVAGKVTGLAPGIYRYEPATHELQKIAAGDRRQAIYDASAGQTFVKKAPASIVYSAVYERNTKRYGDRGRERYVCMDAGHSAENVYLQCTALGLGTCAVGAFLDDDLRTAVHMTRPEEPLYVMPVGRLPE